MAFILVVDDEPDIRSLVQVNLELDGHRVITAVDGGDGLRMIEAHLPDMVILDLTMPNVDGWEVLAVLKGGDGPTSRIPVVILTAHDSVDTRIRSGIEGALRCLPKPFGLDDLRREVAAALAGGPEPAQRLAAQRAALQQLVRSEAGTDRGPDGAVHPHLTRLERRREPVVQEDPLADVRGRVESLTDKQRALLQQVAITSSVSDAADELGVSRSNVYASLRRIARRLGLESVPEMLALARDGRLLGTGQ